MSMIYDPNPAVYSDTIFSFLLYFNIEDAKSLEPFINPKKRAADIKYYRDQIAKFDIPAEELAPLFTVYRTQSFAFSRMYDYMSRMQDFSLEALKAYLPDAATLILEVLHFYAPEEIADAVPSVAELTAIIGAMETTPLVKYHLLAMTINPQVYYDLLLTALEARLDQMTAYYKANKSLIDGVKKAINEEEVRAFLENRYSLTGQTLAEDTAYSVMLVGKNAVRFVQGERPFLIIGFDYSARMAILMGESIKPDIVKMGKALSEEKRVMALHLMLEKGEITAQQLLRALDLSMTATHYHLEMLLQAGMLCTRNEGRTIFYSVNRDYFDRAPMVFEPFNTSTEEE